MKCANCKKREGTTKWLGEQGSFALSHGFYDMWCEFCIKSYQVDYVLKQIQRLPELYKRLDELRKDEASAV